MNDAAHLWSALALPMLRLLLGLAAGLLVANLLENLHWTRHLARLAAPLARWAHLSPVVAASFSTAFFSPSAANALLAEGHDSGILRPRELMLANLFNSLPSYLVHTPTIFLLSWPVLGTPALIYVGLTLLAATCRTLGTVAVARAVLPAPSDGCVECLLHESGPTNCRNALDKAWTRFLRRIPRLVCFTVPVYVIMYLLQRYGFFQTVEVWMSGHAEWLAFLKPQAMGIVALHLSAEMGAALSAAGSVLHSGALDARDVILALLVGNILSTPMRALRHQLPSYSGFFRAGLAMRLILSNQCLRAASLGLVTVFYYSCTS